MNVKIKCINAKNTKVKAKVAKVNFDSKEFKQWRKKAGITQIEFCKEAEISQASLSNFESDAAPVSPERRKQIYETFVRLRKTEKEVR